MLGYLREPLGERIRVQRSHGGQRAQDDEVERALQERDGVFTRHASEDASVALGCQVVGSDG